MESTSLQDSCCSSASTSSSDANEVTCCSIFGFTNNDLLKSGFYRTKVFKNIICCACGWESSDVKLSLRHINFNHKICNPDCEMGKHVFEDIPNYINLKKRIKDLEDMMKETFLAWPKPYPNIEKMVQAGFYYTGSDDSAACVSCGVVLDQWNIDDCPINEHKKASPYCNLLPII